MNPITRTRNNYLQPLNFGRDFGSIFDDFFQTSSDVTSQSGFSPACDIQDTENSFIFTFDIPGMKKEAIIIEFKENKLSVSGKREHESKDAHRVERFSGSFFRSFILPTHVNPKSIKATYQDGVLTVDVPKSEDAKPTTISVQ